MEITTNGDILSANGSTSVDESQCKAYTRLIMHTVVAGAICLLGFVGNSVSFLVLIRDKGTPVASFMLQALASIDNFFLCLWFLHFSLSELFSYFQISLHTAWLYIRLYSYPLLFVGQTATIWMTVLIAINRYIAVCLPYRVPQLCTIQIIKRGIASVAVFSIVYNIPRFFETRITYKAGVGISANSSDYAYERTGFGDSYVYKLIYFDVYYYIVCFGLPLLVLAALNTKLTVSYRQILQRRRRLSIRSLQQDTCDHNITLVMILVIMTFMVCNTPARIVQMIWRYKPQECHSSAFLLMEISNVLEVLNSSVNFLIYCVFRKQFRSIISQTMCRNRPVAYSHYANVQLHVNPNDQVCDNTGTADAIELQDKHRSAHA